MNTNNQINEGRMNLKFETGISKLLKKTYPLYDLDSSANTFISEQLNLIFNAYIKNIKDLGTELPKVEDIQTITENLLPANLKRYAISEAQKEVFTAQTFSVNFVPNRKKLHGKTEFKALAGAKEKERDSLSYNFDSALRLIVNDEYPNHKLDKKGSQKMSNYLLDVSDSTNSHIKHYKPNQRTVEDIQQIDQDMFPSSLANLAKSEGQIPLFDFHNKMFQFQPEKYKSSTQVNSKRSLVSTRKSNDAGAKDFKNGLSTLLAKMHKNASLDKKAEELICKDINDLRTYFINFMKHVEQPNTYEQVQDAVMELFPPLMAKYAIAEGQRLLRSLEIGEISLNSTETQSKEQVTKTLKVDEVNAKTICDSGVVSVRNIMQPGATLHNSSSSLASETVDDFFKILIKNMHDASMSIPDIRRAVSDIRSVVEKILPESLLEHALAEGEKMIRFYEIGALKFFPEKKKQT